jgi:hypothetical protein
MDVIRSISYIKTKTITDSKASLIRGIKEAFKEIKLIKSGKRRFEMLRIF